jgi:hypothetical protein
VCIEKYTNKLLSNFWIFYLTSNPPLMPIKSIDPPFFPFHYRTKKSEKFRHIQFSTPDSPVFAEFIYFQPFGRYFMLRFGFFQILTILGCLWHRFLGKSYTKKKFSQKFARLSLNTNPKGIYIPD